MAQYGPGRGDLIQLRPRAGTMQVSRGRTALVFRRDGVIEPDQPMQGLYLYNTRILGRYCWRMNGKLPEFSCGSNLEQSAWMAYFIETPENCEETPAKKCEPLEETLELRLTRSVGEGMHEDVHLTNHTQVATTVRLELEFEHQFVAQDEVKKGRKQNGDLNLEWSHPGADLWELMADYRVEHEYDHQGNKGVAHLHRGMKLRIEHATSEPRYEDEKLRFDIHLPPHGEFHACLSWIAYMEGKELPLTPRCSRREGSDWNLKRQQFFAEAAKFTAPHSDDLTSSVLRTLDRSRLDLGDLRLYDLDTPDGVAPAAGVPTYQEVFGRDMQAASWQAAMLTPSLLRGTLETLRKRVAKDNNPWRDAEPGRIPHEIHTDPLSELNFQPMSLYYGSASAAYLVPVSVSELWHWNGDLNAVRNYVDMAVKAIQWADKYSLDKTGFYRYQTSSIQGVKNQGWKDSPDAIVDEDGKQVHTPIGTCEMQGFMYVAKLHFSEVMFRLGHIDAARKMYTEAEDLKKRFNDRFWMDDEGYFAMGIGPDGGLIRAIASDPGHCLLSGIVDESRVKQVAARMMREDLYSGWGVRTLSTKNPAFNPFAYHRGTVWPVTNAGFVLAFSRYGLHGEMWQLAKSMFEAAAMFQHYRLPEVFAGHARTDETPFPGLYTEANWPQAWSASSVFTMMQAMLGIYPYAPAGVLFLDPHLPEWLPEITVERLQIGRTNATVRFYRTEKGTTAYEVKDAVGGPLHVVRQPSPWSLTTGWGERVRDAVASIVSSAGKVA